MLFARRDLKACGFVDCTSITLNMRMPVRRDGNYLEVNLMCGPYTEEGNIRELDRHGYIPVTLEHVL